MIFSYSSALQNFSLNNGYGVAGWHIINSLKKLGHEVYFDTPKAPVELTFCQPEYYKPRTDQYQIIYTPWESTKLKNFWKETFNSADATWTTSDWVAGIYEKEGVNNLTTVYPHGIGKEWTPLRKYRKGPIKFLNLGGPANRKGWQETLDAFREAFGDDPKRAHLTIKAYQRNLARWYDSAGRVRNPNDLPNVTVITKEMTQPELRKFSQGFDCLVYPSYSEGMGLIPMQSLAQGTPTICTGEWAHYSKYLGDLSLNSSMVDSPWSGEHPGQVCKPDQQHLIELMLKVESDYERLAKQFFAQSFEFHSEYDWVKLTKQAFDPIVQQFST